MTDQLAFADAIAARDRAIQQVEDHAHDAWLEAAYDAVACLAQTRDEFTTDDCWAILDDSSVATHEPRAMGAVMKRAAKDGLIEATGRYTQSARKVNHARPVMVYRSKMKDAA